MAPATLLGINGGDLERRTFKGSARAQLLPLGGALLMVSAFLWRAGFEDGWRLNGWGYYAVAIFIVILFFGGANVLAPASLTLDSQGFTWKSWRYTAQFNWADIERFTLGLRNGLGGRPKIAFTFSPGKVTSQKVATAANRSINGYDRSMANVWAISSEDLVAMLNEYLDNSRLK